MDAAASCPFLFQPDEQFLFVLQHPIQTAVQSILRGYGKVGFQ
jgi:hypothetical protein